MHINSAALPLIAILRKGAPRPSNGRAPGRDLDHFRADFQPRFAHLAEAFAEMYGDEPVEIPGVRFISDEPFSFYYELWGGNQTLKARHDGECWIKRWTDRGYNYDRDPIDPDNQLARDCQPRGRLTFALPAFFRATGELGVFLMLTSSEIDASTIQSYLALLLTVGGTLNGIEFILYREPRQFTVPITDKGTGEVKRSSVTKHMIYLKADPAMVRDLGAGMNAPQLSSGGRALPAPTLPALETPATPVEDAGDDLDSGPSDRGSWGRDGQLIKALKSGTGLDGPTIMGRLAHMENNGLITKQTSQCDVYDAVLEALQT